MSPKPFWKTWNMALSISITYQNFPKPVRLPFLVQFAKKRTEGYWLPSKCTSPTIIYSLLKLVFTFSSLVVSSCNFLYIKSFIPHTPFYTPHFLSYPTLPLIPHTPFHSAPLLKEPWSRNKTNRKIFSRFLGFFFNLIEYHNSLTLKNTFSGICLSKANSINKLYNEPPNT